jgi:hypothetical protein
MSGGGRSAHRQGRTDSSRPAPARTEWWKSYRAVTDRLNTSTFYRRVGAAPTPIIKFYKHIQDHPRRAQLTRAEITKIADRYKIPLPD